MKSAWKMAESHTVCTNRDSCIHVTTQDNEEGGEERGGLVGIMDGAKTDS